MGGLRYITSSNIIILPKNCILGNSRLANQPFFKYIKRKITPTEIQKIMQKKVGLHRQLCWRAGLLHSFSSKMVRALFNICCQAGFCGLSARTRQLTPKVRLAFLLVRRRFGVAEQRTKTSFCFPIFSGVASDIKQPVFNTTLYAWSLNK